MKSFEETAAFIRQNELGRRACVETPFGRRLLCYADLTATGRYLHFVEQWIRRVRPFYANTHTAISSTGRIMTELREEARRVVHRSLRAGPDDTVLFVGSGATAAINKLIGMLGLRIPEALDRDLGLSRLIPPSRRPVVLVGPYEHHSNELPWVESIADVTEIKLDGRGLIDLEDLELQLQRHADRPFKIGSFSAASNVTGLLTDVRAVARILHRHGAIACFDYAAAAPYVPIDMHPATGGPGDDERIDALFLSTHKFIGGPQASGVLVAHRALFQNDVPERPGGGTVDYVAACRRDAVDYVRRLDEREEGGTPAIMGDLRAGVAFLVKEMIQPERILEHEVRIAQRAMAQLSRHPAIRLLGPTEPPRLAIISFNIERLHHDFVATLLDHLFGIQNRAGCSCAGPYGHKLLAIDHERSEQYRRQIALGRLGVKPGWVRLSLPWYASEQDLSFILSAVEFVAEHGRDLVPAYRLDWRSGVWSHMEKPVPDVPPLELTVAALEEAAQSFAAGDHEAPLSEARLAAERARSFAEANQIAALLRERVQQSPPRWNPSTGNEEVDALVWFDYVNAGGLDAGAHIDA